jgi:predicted amidohydrolase YtcJ
VAADLLLFNGVIHTMDPARPLATAAAVRGGRILVVGTSDEARAALGTRPEMVDLGGRCVLPGLTDSHIHFRWYAESLDGVHAETPTLGQALERVRAKAERALPGAWITGCGWNHNTWAGDGGAAQFPDRHHLDRAAPRNPVALKAKSGHALWASSLALRAAGVTENTADPPTGRILREPGGGGRTPSGILLEDAMPLVQSAIPPLGPDTLAELMKGAQAALHAVGLAGIHDYDNMLTFRALQLLEAEGLLTLRVVKGIPHELLGQAVELGLRSGYGSGMLSLGALKMFADGALGPRTAWMLEPYEGGGDGERGIATLAEERMVEDVRRANAAGIACAVHAIGDAACRAVLNAFEKAGSRPAGEPPNRLEHAQLLHPADLPRLARLGVVASMQPIHATSDMLIADRHWGARAATGYAWKSLLESDAVLAFGSDCPVEIPDPLAGIHAAVTRRRADGSPGPGGWRAGQRLTVEQAVRAYTEGAAFAAGKGSERGRIAAGMRGDFTVLDRDIFAIDPHGIVEARAAATIVDGRLVYRAF